MHFQTRRVATLAITLLIAILFIGNSAHAQLAGASKPKPQMTLKRADSQYKRIHQFVLRMIEKKDDKAARETLEKHLGKYPTDPESHFMMGMLHANRDRVDDALASFEKALENGLPPGRIIAGPRAILKSVANHQFVTNLVEKHRHDPVHGPMVGNVTHQQAAIWVRTAAPANVQLIVSKSPDMTDSLKSPIAKSTAETDFTAIPKITGLQSETQYYYQVSIDGHVPNKRPAAQRFRTFLAPNASSKFTLAFGGGAGYVPPHEKQWNVIDTFNPDLMLLLGDNVYIDDPESDAMQKYTYYRRQSRPEFRNVTAHTPVFTIWDDHDFGTNDCWGGPEIARPQWKKESVFPIFRQNWVNPGYAGGDQQPGCWYTFRVGDVDFVMLDCRYYRTNPKGNSPTILGPAQKKWLRETLPTLKGKFKVVVSSVPWEYRTKGDSRDTWNGYKSERDEIFGYFETFKMNGVILMSADRHRSDAWKIERPRQLPVFTNSILHD